MSAVDKQDWFFTFGAGQEYDGYYVRVRNADFSQARMKMVIKFGSRWSGQYNKTDFTSERLGEKLEKLEDL